MEKPDFVNKENFECLMTEESDPIKNFELIIMMKLIYNFKAVEQKRRK